MERQPPPKILQLKYSMYHANFCTKYETIGPPRRARGLPSFSMDEEYHAYDLGITFTFFRPAPSSTSRPGDWPPGVILEVLPAVRQVVCRLPSLLLPKVAVRRIGCPAGKS